MGAIRNVLLVTWDQWRADCLSAAGHPVVRTPNADRLAARGVHFANHCAQAAPCGPSRASLFTGLYMHNHGSVQNGTPLDARHPNLATALRGAGWDPVLFGYTDASVDPRTVPPDDPRLCSYEGILPGFRPVVDLTEALVPWARWLADLGYDVPADPRDLYLPTAAGHTAYAAEHSEAAFLTGETIAHLERHGADPWFVHVAYIRPHPPFVAPAPYHEMYDPADVPPPVRHAGPDDLAALNPYVAALLPHPLVRAPDDDGELRRLRATYYGMITEVDAQFGRLLDWLESAGMLDDTLVLLTSDHGELLGDHWLLGKLAWFDEAYRIPLIVHDPRAEADATRGATLHAFTENIDVAPTVLELTGIERPRACDGRSLAPLLEGREPERWRSAMHWEFDFRHPQLEKRLGLTQDQCSLAVLRDDAGEYVHFAGLPPLFFDLRRDPDRLVDRSRDPGCAEVVRSYAQRMLSWRMEHSERTLTGMLVTEEGLVDRR